jgi:hypothetical protein
VSKKKTEGSAQAPLAATAADAGSPERKPTRYSGILTRIFANHYRKGVASFEFQRSEIERVAQDLGVVLPKNLGDLIYSFRFRSTLPEEIARTAPPDREWVIELAGRGKYRMALRRIHRIVPSPDHYEIKIPDATPEIIARYAFSDEQALLAKVRYNRLIDVFLRVTAYSLQNHLRTSVPDLGQIETDEVYVAVRNTGQQFVVPVQAKGGTDKVGAVQVQQDLALCKHAFPDLTPRPVAVQFKKDERGEAIVMFELIEDGDEIKVVDEKHYRLVAADSITPEDLATMAQSSD